MKPIYIFSQPIRSGKTTTLMQWVKNKSNISGILAPDLDGLRYIYTLHNKEFHRFQVKENYNYKDDPIITVGKYNFLSSSFELAKTAIKNNWSKNEWLIIDEVGKLEVKDSGLEPIVSQTIEHYKYLSETGKLLLIVRADLLDSVLEKYNIVNYHLINESFFGLTS